MTTNEGIVHTESEEKEKLAVQLTIKCKIEKFGALMNSARPGSGRLASDDVSSKLAPHDIWRLGIYPNGHNEQNRGRVSVFLQLDGTMVFGSGTRRTAPPTSTYLFDESGKIDSIARGIKGFGEQDGSWTPDHDKVRRALHADGSLVVAAEIDFLPPNDGSAKASALQGYDGSAKAICEASALQGYEDRGQWADKFSELHGDPTTSDCSIQIDGETLPAHKSILMAHSPVFRAMFTNPLAEEPKRDVVKITDSKDPAPMRALLSYCYRGHLDVETMDGEWTEEIFKLACKYRIDDLKALLEKHYIDNTLSVGNVVAMAVLADVYLADKLKEACTKLIAREVDTVFESPYWKELEKANPTLTIQLAIAACRMK